MLIFIVLAILCLWWLWYKSREPVKIYHFGDPEQPPVTFLAGTHGNEPAATEALERLAARLEKNPDVAGHIAIVPRVDARASRRGVRSAGLDLNRCWPAPDGQFLSPVKALVDRSRLVIDLHEAWSFEFLNEGSLGQTVFAVNVPRDPVARMVTRLNVLPELDRPEMKWKIMPRLPPLRDGHALDEYCEANRKPYILVETAGQRDVVPRAVRLLEYDTIFKYLLINIPDMV